MSLAASLLIDFTAGASQQLSCTRKKVHIGDKMRVWPLRQPAALRPTIVMEELPRPKGPDLIAGPKPVIEANNANSH
jgi:hypothetical protein